MELHGRERVVLVAHQGCALYATRLQFSEPRLELVQGVDLVRAVAFVNRLTGLDAIDASFSRLVEDRVRFESVEA